MLAILSFLFLIVLCLFFILGKVYLEGFFNKICCFIVCYLYYIDSYYFYLNLDLSIYFNFCKCSYLLLVSFSWL